MCSLNIDIPSSVNVTWLHNGRDVVTTPNETITVYNTNKTGNTTALTITNPQPSDAGVYQCVFNDTVGMWTLKRNLCED